MLGEALKKLLNVLLIFLAALAFFTVQVGKKTPAQHLVAIFETKPAREAASAFAATARKIATKVRAEIERG